MDIRDFPKVVAFSGNGARNGGTATPLRSIPKPVMAVRDTACSWLLARMKEVFAGVDDALFAGAEKVVSREEQDGLFHALRLLRLERDRITERFVTAVRIGFHDVEEGPCNLEGDESASDDGLSLLHNEDLEQQVALKIVIAAVKRDYASPIAELALRLDTLLSVKVYDENMPLAPSVLCRALQRALKSLDIHLRARLTLLKKFEQLLAAKLGSLYQTCNQTLIDHGVLPSLTDPLLQRCSKPGALPVEAPGGAVPGQQGGASPSEPPGVGAGMEMPAGAVPAMRGSPVSGLGVSTDIGAGGYGLLPSGVGVVALATPELLQHLGALQALPQGGAAGQVLDVSSLLQQRLVEAQQGASLQELDTEIIRMVDMLFTFMLEDRNLAEPIKVQLIRLQLPLLKLGIADKAFFSKGGHPARRLFNALADAAIGWQPGENYQDDPFYREICDIVEQVLQSFDCDEGVFTRLLQDFGEYVAHERRRAQMLERRTVDEAEGNARVEAARARVAAVFDALTAERKLPRAVHEWLNRVWDGVLFRTCLKEGTDSDDWRSAVLTARDLVWSVVAPMPESRLKLQQLLPGLRRRLDAGAESLAINPGERRRLLQGLDQLYRERQGLGERVESERERRARERLVQELRREADSVVAIPEIPAVAEAEVELYGDPFDDAAPDLPEDLLQVLDRETDLPAVEELQKAVRVAPLQQQGQLEPLADSDEYWRQTYHLKDSWFMLHLRDKSSVRCRLAAIIKDLDQFMLVSRTGAKVAVYSRLELAHALRTSMLTSLERGPLFERALQYVVGNLGESKISVSAAGVPPEGGDTD